MRSAPLDERRLIYFDAFILTNQLTSWRLFEIGGRGGGGISVRSNALIIPSRCALQESKRSSAFQLEADANVTHVLTWKAALLRRVIIRREKEERKKRKKEKKREKTSGPVLF
jgi:hypothetical protein